MSMPIRLACAALLASVAFTAWGQDPKPAAPAPAPAAAPAANTKPQVEIVTSLGTIVLELDAAKAPKSVENFLSYVDSGFYDGTIFHRVIGTFMIQGGGFTADMAKKPTKGAIQNEADNGLSNMKYTVAMARTGEPHSATSQFFINTADNRSLDHRNKEGSGWGYTVFGKVVKGSEVVDKIAKVATGTHGAYSDVPSTPVVMTKVTRKQ